MASAGWRGGVGPGPSSAPAPSRAPPYPATASLTWFGVYWATSHPAAAASARASPLAWPTLIAVRTLTWKNTCSTATAAGRNSAISAASSARRAASRCGSGSPAGVRITPRAIGDDVAGPRPSMTAYPHRVSPGSMPSTRVRPSANTGSQASRAIRSGVGPAAQSGQGPLRRGLSAYHPSGLARLLADRWRFRRPVRSSRPVRRPCDRMLSEAAATACEGGDELAHRAVREPGDRPVGVADDAVAVDDEHAAPREPDRPERAVQRGDRLVGVGEQRERRSRRAWPRSGRGCRRPGPRWPAPGPRDR